MQLIVYNINNNWTKKDFILILELLKKSLRDSINDKKLIKWDNLFKSLGYKFSAREVIELGIDNLVFASYLNRYVVYINDNIKIDGIKVSKLCKMINYGTFNMKAYPIFTTGFNKFKNINGERL